MQRIRGKLSFSNVVALLALFVALGGSAYAATQLPKNSVGAKQLKRRAVTPAKLSSASKSALAGPKGPAGPQGAPGPAGLQGPKGDRGEPATSLLAHISADAEILGGSGVTEAEALEESGTYFVRFDRNVSECNFQATVGSVLTEASIAALPPEDEPDTIYVEIISANGSPRQKKPFYLAVFCP